MNPGRLAVLLLAFSVSALGAPPPIEYFARMPSMQNVSISPDGRYLAYINGNGDVTQVVVRDRTGKSPDVGVWATHGQHEYDFTWCGWANATRLLCGVLGSVEETVISSKDTRLADKPTRFAVSRLVAVNADGTGNRTLMNNQQRGGFSQFQDNVLDWTPNDPDTVLIELDDDGDGFPSVFELNVNDGTIKLNTVQHPPIRDFWSDRQGGVRLGRGFGNNDAHIGYFGRALGKTDWQPLASFVAFANSNTLLPLAVIGGSNRVLAAGDSDGRDALWEFDLEEKQEPKLVYAKPGVDVSTPILSGDGRMLGVSYETDRPGAYYTNKRAQSVIEGANQFVPDAFNEIYDMTPDQKIYVIHSASDIDYGTYYLLDVGSGKGELEQLGTGYPELKTVPLARMQSIEYKASDGTMIPGYLTTPLGVEAKNLPLVVMPHGGPIARDSWDFDFVRAFLVSRGYAVLQMNFRGSDGYGWQWFHAAHQDWGGLTYSDIVDGTRWAAAQGIADPKRMCIVGWSFGGYAALLGAVRNSDLYRCAVSIAGVSNLRALRIEAGKYINRAIVREQLGANADKLAADSPIRHANDINIPVLLVHGEFDYTVPIDHSKEMAAALKRTHKVYQYVVIKRADHQLRLMSDRVALLDNLEKFINLNLGPGLVAKN